MSAKKRLGELLHEAGLIDEPQLQAALGHQRRWGGRLGRALVDLRMVEERELVQVLARSLGHEVARLDAVDPASEAACRLVPVGQAQRCNVLPLSLDTTSLTVAMSDPTDLALIDELRFRTGRRIKVLIAGDRELAAAIRRRYGLGGEATEAIALEGEATGEGVPLAEPFEGGSTEAMTANLASTPPRRTPPPLPASPPVAPRPGPASAAAEPLTPREAALLDALERALAGQEDATGLVRPARLLAVLARILVRRGLVSERELLAELKSLAAVPPGR